MKCSTCINYISQPLSDSPCNSCVHRSHHYRLGMSDNYHFDTKTIAGVAIFLVILSLAIFGFIKVVYYLMGG